VSGGRPALGNAGTVSGRGPTQEFLTEIANGHDGVSNIRGANAMRIDVQTAPIFRFTQDTEMTDLLDFAIKAAGGMERYNSFKSVSAKLHHTGIIWALKQREGVLDHSNVTSDLKSQTVSHYPFAPTLNHSVFTPGRVDIISPDKTIVESLENPRASFAGYELETPWSNAQLAYFAGYTMSTYLRLPFVLVGDGIVTEEIEPWVVDGQPWRRLRVTFPDSFATHSKVQTFYFDADGLCRRHDYEVEIQGNNAAARYIYDYIEVQGLMVPTRFRIFPRTPENVSLAEPLIVGVDLSEFCFV
jgi:hypothetical protein